MTDTVLRWLRHALTPPLAVRRAFPPAALARIEQAIDAAERGHSGQIRFAVEARLPWSYLRRQAPVRERALMVFAKLRLWDTEDNNGVLVYVELADHGLEIVADRGLARRVEAARWEAITAALRTSFRARRYEEGVAAAVAAVGGLLRETFPRAADAAPPPDALPNRPVVL